MMDTLKAIKIVKIHKCKMNHNKRRGTCENYFFSNFHVLIYAIKGFVDGKRNRLGRF
jgi:hypothetical protein